MDEKSRTGGFDQRFPRTSQVSRLLRRLADLSIIVSGLRCFA